MNTVGSKMPPFVVPWNSVEFHEHARNSKNILFETPRACAQPHIESLALTTLTGLNYYRKLRNQTGNRELGSVNREPVGTGTGLNRNRFEQYCTVLYCTVQDLLFVITKKKEKSQT